MLYTVKENTGPLVAANKECALEVNADKTKYMVISRDQNAGQSRDIKIDYSSVERVEEFKYLGKTLKNQNSLCEEIKRRLKSGNACCHPVCYPNIQRLIYILYIILAGVLYGCETLSLNIERGT